jgi:membrane fusion protein (multidrug efflux system)
MTQRISAPWAIRLLATLIFASACLPAGAQHTTTSVTVTPPARGSIHRWLKLPGTIRPLREATLYAKVAGYLQEIRVDIGDSVPAGATLAILETPELSAERTRHRAEVAAARAEYERLQQAIRQAPDLVMPVEIDRAKGKFEVAGANLERIETLLRYSAITAPFAGTITKRFVDPGAFIPAATSGSAAQNAAVVTLMDFNAVRVQVAVPDTEAARVRTGLPVRFAVTGLPERTFDGVITRFAYALEDASKTMRVEVEVPNPERVLRPGMYASVELALDRHDDALLIPAAALIMEKTNAFAYLADGDTARKRAIKIGFNDGKNVEVNEGLGASDRVIVAQGKTLSDGLAIQATEAR